MVMDIKQIIKEEVNNKRPYKFHEGGYLIPSNDKIYPGYRNTNIMLSDGEFQKLEKLNDNIKELYENELEELRLRKLHHRGVMQKAMDKITNDPNFNFKS